MLEAMVGFFNDAAPLLEGIARNYGLFGLFISALVGSTIFVPFSVEALLPILIELNFDLYQIILVAGTGALIGTWVNYWIGRLATGYVTKKLGDDRINQAKAALDKHGLLGLFVVIFAPIPLPIPVDPLTIIPGIAKMDFVKFSVVVFLAKIARYAVFVGLMQQILSLMGL